MIVPDLLQFIFDDFSFGLNFSDLVQSLIPVNCALVIIATKSLHDISGSYAPTEVLKSGKWLKLNKLNLNIYAIWFFNLQVSFYPANKKVR